MRPSCSFCGYKWEPATTPGVMVLNDDLTEDDWFCSRPCQDAYLAQNSGRHPKYNCVNCGGSLGTDALINMQTGECWCHACYSARTPTEAHALALAVLALLERLDLDSPIRLTRHDPAEPDFDYLDHIHEVERLLAELPELARRVAAFEQ